MWIFIFSYVGNYFWTHYFYKVLHAYYTFPVKWQLNEVRSVACRGEWCCRIVLCCVVLCCSECCDVCRMSCACATCVSE